MESTKTIKWQTKDGKSIEAQIVVVKEVNDKISYSDGWNLNLGKETYESLNITVLLEGKKVASSRQEPSVIKEKLFSQELVKRAKENNGYAIIDNKVIINKERYEEIMAAIAEAKTETENEEFTAIKKEEKAVEARKEEREKKAVEAYQKELANGLCPKCGTYCYGDCEY